MIFALFLNVKNHRMNDQIVNPHTSLNLHVKSFAMLPLCWKITFVEKRCPWRRNGLLSGIFTLKSMMDVPLSPKLLMFFFSRRSYANIFICEWLYYYITALMFHEWIPKAVTTGTADPWPKERINRGGVKNVDSFPWRSQLYQVVVLWAHQAQHSS